MSTHNIPLLNMKKEIILNYPKSAKWNLFQGTQEGVRNSRGKGDISVRAIEVLLYMYSDTNEYCLLCTVYSVLCPAYCLLCTVCCLLCE